jgi:alpha-tubulin suppressor-like RCC1 family protein
VPGTFTATTNQVTCAPFTDCVPGERVVTEGSNTANRVCVHCDVGTSNSTTNATTCELRIVDLACSNVEACVVISDGTVRCWGFGGAGRLGYGNQNNIGDNEEPVTAGTVDVGGFVTQISVGYQHVCARLAGGAVRCWGTAAYGRLGYGNEINVGDDETPASVGDVPLGGSAQKVVTGDGFSCALLENGAVRCWGRNREGQLGYGNTTYIGDNEYPSTAGTVNVGAGTIVDITAGSEHACVLMSDGAVRCWGLGSYGQLGYGNTSTIGDNEFPSTAGDVSLGGKAIAISAGTYTTCAVLDTGAVRCWGEGTVGQLGYGNTNLIGDDELPSTTMSLLFEAPATAVSTGGVHTCVRLTTGALRCWGYNKDGELGLANTTSIGDNESPLSIPSVPLSPGETVVKFCTQGHFVATLDRFAATCVLLGNGAVRCWGSGFYGQLGLGNTNTIGDDEYAYSVGYVHVF